MHTCSKNSMACYFSHTNTLKPIANANTWVTSIHHWSLPLNYSDVCVPWHTLQSMVDKKMMHQSTSTAGNEEVGGRRRRQRMNRGGGPGRREAVAREVVETVMQQPVRADDMR